MELVIKQKPEDQQDLMQKQKPEECIEDLLAEKGPEEEKSQDED